MTDPLHDIILNGADPAAVLPVYAKALGGAIIKMADTPLNYLRFRSKDPISDVQHEAALWFLGAFEPGGGGSNTNSVCETAARLALPAAKERKERERIRAIEADGRQIMHGRDDSRGHSDPERRIIQRIDRQTHVRVALRSREISVLYDLLVEDRPIGAIARRWGVEHSVVSLWVREALLELAAYLEKRDPKFQEIVASTREREMDHVA